MYIDLVKHESAQNTEDMDELFMRSGWNPLSKCVHCKILPYMNNATCILTINDDVYQITIKDEIINVDSLSYIYMNGNYIERVSSKGSRCNYII